MNPQPDAQPLLEIRDLTIGFADLRGVFLAADRINLNLNTNQTLGLLGESGCGKSVTLRSILGLVPYPGDVVAGSICWKGRDLRTLRRRDLTKIRGKEISMIFQDPTSCLNPVFTVGNQLTETLRLQLNLPPKAATERAAELLAHVGIPSPYERLKLYPHQLSGGMRQRVMIAIAIASQPALLLADEPTTALDVTIQDQILNLLASLKAETGMSMILVSHDVGVVAQNCDVIAVMYAGERADDQPNDERDVGGDDAKDEVYLPGVEDAGEDVPAEVVRAEGEFSRRRLERIEQVGGVRVAEIEQGRGKAEKRNRHNDDDAEPERDCRKQPLPHRAAAKPPEGVSGNVRV